MLKSIIVTLLFTYMAMGCFAQTITGNWKGTFSDGMTKLPISLEFILNADSSYTVHSYSLGLDNLGKPIVVVCDVYYEFIGKDSLYLEEMHRISPLDGEPSCLQKMYLKIRQRKKMLVLDGIWRTASSDVRCSNGGSIYFSKKKTAE
jgi:hypothetical protein